MTNDEAKEAFRNKTPVYYNGGLYTKISAIISIRPVREFACIGGAFG